MCTLQCIRHPGLAQGKEEKEEGTDEMAPAFLSLGVVHLQLLAALS